MNRAMVVGVVDADIVGSGAERLRRRLHGESYGCPWPREGGALLRDCGIRQHGAGPHEAASQWTRRVLGRLNP